MGKNANQVIRFPWDHIKKFVSSSLCGAAQGTGGHEWLWDSRCSGREGRHPRWLLAGPVMVESTAARRLLGMLPLCKALGSVSSPSRPPRRGDAQPLSAAPPSRSAAWHRPGGTPAGRDGKGPKASPASGLWAHRQLPANWLPGEGGMGLFCWPPVSRVPLKSPQIVL